MFLYKKGLFSTNFGKIWVGRKKKKKKKGPPSNLPSSALTKPRALNPSGKKIGKKVPTFPT